jgi:hypothetical protein
VSDLPDIINSIETGLKTLVDLPDEAVTDQDWLVLNQPNSLFVFPSGEGAQGDETFDSYYQVHRITVELWLKNEGDIKRLYTDAQTYIVAILAWFRANDTLGGTVEKCHEGPITYQAVDVRQEGTFGANGILYRLVSFKVPVKVTIDA